MAKATSNEGDTGQQPEAPLPQVNPDDVPGTAKTILSTRPGYAFVSGVEGVDTITEHGVRVPKDKVDAVLAAAEPNGEGFLTVTEA